MYRYLFEITFQARLPGNAHAEIISIEPCFKYTIFYWPPRGFCFGKIWGY